MFEGGPVAQTVVEMQRGLLIMMAISDGSSIAVLAAPARAGPAERVSAIRGWGARAMALGGRWSGRMR